MIAKSQYNVRIVSNNPENLGLNADQRRAPIVSMSSSL